MSNTWAIIALIGDGRYQAYLAFVKARGWVTSWQPITDALQVAIWAYTAADGCSERVNEELWEGQVSSEVEDFSPVLKSALRKMFKYGGTVYRGYSDSDLDFFLEGYEVGKLKTLPAFTSTTKDMGLAFYGNVLFIIKAHDGPDVEKFSAIPSEKEVLFPAGEQFHVVAIERDDESVIVELEQVTL